MTTPTEHETVAFSDYHLESAIREALGKITSEELMIIRQNNRASRQTLPTLYLSNHRGALHAIKIYYNIKEVKP